MRLLKLIMGGIVTIAAALMISYWPYNFTPLLDTEYSLEWQKKEVPVAMEIAPGIVMIEKKELHEAYQIHDHWDIAGEVVLHWQFLAKNVQNIDGSQGMASYLAWECPKKEPFEHWHIGRLWGRMVMKVPMFGQHRFHTLEAAKMAVTYDYLTAVYGLNAVQYEPEDPQIQM